MDSLVEAKKTMTFWLLTLSQISFKYSNINNNKSVIQHNSAQDTMC